MPSASVQLSSFGIDREFEYSGHISLATHLVPLPRRTFASSDETHIRIWGPSGDIVKTTFPSNRRSMVSAMTYCPTFQALLTTEVDMTLKAYFIHTLDLLDSFSLGQAHKKGENERSIEKVSAIVYLPQHCWVLVGGENGCDLWQLGKSNRRRTGGSVGRMEHHLQLVRVRRVTSGSVLNIVADMGEQRLIMWGTKSLSIYDTELNFITSYRQPHAEPLHCACIQILSILDTALLTGGEDGHVNFWSIQGKQHEGAIDDPNEKLATTASMRLEHSFRGHARTVEMVCFYNRKQPGLAPTLCVSYARDGKMKVWSLVQFSMVYTLDISFLDSKVCAFPLGNHSMAVSSTASGGSESGQGQQRTIVALVRFTSHMACPFATTNRSPVVLINRPPPPLDFKPGSSGTLVPTLAGAVALVSEDVAIRIVDADAKRLIACLPPPPNSMVQVLCVFIVPVWQILVLWMSSQEIAIFFVPLGGETSTKERDANGRAAEGNRAVTSTTPLLIRRFGVLEVCAHSFDKDLPKESFRSVCLHHGSSPPRLDALTKSSFEENAPPSTKEISGNESEADWFLMLGTHQGTLQAYRLQEILAASPIWGRIVRHLPPGSWQAPSACHVPTRKDAAQSAASEIEQARLDAFEAELAEALKSAKLAGQRPFPRDSPKLCFYGRWKCHDFFIEVTESVCNTLMTLDMKRNLKIWNVRTMQCIFLHQLDEFSCYTHYLQPKGMEPLEAAMLDIKRATSKGAASGKYSSTAGMTNDEEENNFSGLSASPEDVLIFTGLALGNKTGSLQVVLLDNLDEMEQELEVITSASSHTKAILQVDFVWPTNVFVTIGIDNTMKIWTHSLVLLREIAFPQPLTAVSFRQRHDLDAAKGHADILLGFSSHVESLTFDYWSQGTDPSLIGRNALRGRTEHRSSILSTAQGLAMLDFTDDIGEHLQWLHSDNPMQARSAVISTRTGMNEEGAESVACFVNTVVQSLRTPTLPLQEAKVQHKRSQQGEIMDFRGGPLIDIQTLSGQAVDHAALELPSRASKEPSVRHKPINHPTRDDFADYTHEHPGYQDKYVHPNNVVDAPRIQAIRGRDDGNNFAIITSVGTRFDHAQAQLPGVAAVPKAPFTGATSDKMVEDGTLQKDQPRSSAPNTPAASCKTLPAKPAEAPSLATVPSIATVSSAAAVSTTVEQARASSKSLSGALDAPPHEQARASSKLLSGALDAPPQEKQRDSGEEPWRCRRIARGVPKEDTNRPRTQDFANTELDTAVLLKERGNIAEVPDVLEGNQLKRMLVKKSEWLYSPKDSLVLQRKRSTITQMATEQEKTQTWTLAGRLVCDVGNRPPVRSVNIPILTLPHLRQRMPMTRTEVTEQRLIDNACAPPVPAQFTLDARGPEGTVGSKRPSSARRGRKPSSSDPKAGPSLASMGRMLEESPRAAPLTAR